jgi:multicomponent Na+:H+ antiporter subunit C
MSITQDQIYAVTAVLLLCLGLHGVIARPEILRKIMGLNLLGAGVFLFFVTVAWRGDAPADAVPHAMVLTGIVVAVSASAFALGLTRRLSGLDRQARAQMRREKEESPP